MREWYNFDRVLTIHSFCFRGQLCKITWVLSHIGMFFHTLNSEKTVIKYYMYRWLKYVLRNVSVWQVLSESSYCCFVSAIHTLLNYMRSLKGCCSWLPIWWKHTKTSMNYYIIVSLIKIWFKYLQSKTTLTTLEIVRKSFFFGGLSFLAKILDVILKPIFACNLSCCYFYLTII